MKSNINIQTNQLKSLHYVYIVFCSLTGEYYFGKHSTNRKNDGYGGSGSELKKRKKEIGSEHFEITLFARFKSEEEAYDTEEDLIRRFISDIKNLNRRISSRNSLCDHGIYIYPSGKIAKLHINDPDVLSGRAVGHRKGKKHSEETKAKMSKSRKGKKLGPSPIRGKKRPKISIALKGRKKPISHGKNVSIALKGRIITWGAALSEASTIKIKFTQEESDFIFEQKALGLSINKITKAFNEKFNKDISRKPIDRILQI